MSYWQNRFLARDYTDRIPEQSKVDAVANCVNRIPSRISDDDHFWVMFGPEHLEMKIWLVKNVFYHKYYKEDVETWNTSHEHFGFLAKAPYLMVALEPEGVYSFDNKDFQEQNIFFSGGSILAEIVNQELDSSVIGCCEGWQTNKAAKENELAKLMIKLVPDFPRDMKFTPALAVAFGYGINHVDEEPFLIEEFGISWQSRKYFTGKTPNFYRAV